MLALFETLRGLHGALSHEHSSSGDACLVAFGGGDFGSFCGGRYWAGVFTEANVRHLAQYILLAGFGDDVVRPVDEDVLGFGLSAHEGLLGWHVCALLLTEWGGFFFTL